jgi:hypothetical protein
MVNFQATVVSNQYGELQSLFEHNSFHLIQSKDMKTVYKIRWMKSCRHAEVCQLRLRANRLGRLLPVVG